MFDEIEMNAVLFAFADCIAFHTKDNNSFYFPFVKFVFGHVTILPKWSVHTT